MWPTPGNSSLPGLCRPGSEQNQGKGRANRAALFIHIFAHMSNLQTLRFRTVAVQLPANFSAGMEIQIPDQDDLREAIIDAVETFTDADMISTAEGLPVVTDALSANLLFTLAHKSNDRVKHMPYRASRAVLLAGMVRTLSGWAITWPQSRIRCVSDLQNETPVWAVLGIHFRYPSDK